MKIETERLIIRKLQKEDRVLYDALQRENRFIRALPREEEREQTRIDFWNGTQSPHHIGCMIFEKATGDFVGHISLSTKHLPPELGIDLLEAKQNKGYGPEAVRAFLTYFAYRHGVQQVQVRIWESNAHSRHMFEKLGAEFQERRALFNEQELRELCLSAGVAEEDIPPVPAYLVYRLAC